MVCYTKPSLHPLETVRKKASNLKTYFVFHHLSGTDFDQSDQQTQWLAEPVGKSNSYRTQSGKEQKHFFRQEKPSVSFFALQLMKTYSPVLIELIDRTDSFSSIYANHICSRHHCFLNVTHMNHAHSSCQHFLKWRWLVWSPVNWPETDGLKPGKMDLRDIVISRSHESSFTRS